MRGTEEQIAEIEAALKALELGVGSASSAGSAGSVRVITLDQGNADIVAEELQRLLKNLGQNATILKPNDLTDPKKPAKIDKPM